MFFLLFFIVSGTTPQLQAQTPSHIKQEELVEFPKLGQLRVRIVEARGSRRVVFKSSASGKVVNVWPRVGRRDQAATPVLVAKRNEVLYFKVGSVKGIQSQLIFLTKVYRGADHCGYTTDVIGEVGGRLRLLTDKPFENDDMGGMLAGDLGSEAGEGIAVWSFIWGADESHFDVHRYQFDLYKYDTRQSRFVKTKVLSSTQKYPQGEDAAKELQLPPTNFLAPCEELFDDHDTIHINENNRPSENPTSDPKFLNPGATSQSDSPAGYIKRGTENLQLHKFESAVNDFTSALKLDAQNSDAYGLRAFAYMQLKNFDAAIADYQASLRLDSSTDTDEDLHSQLAAAYAMRADQRLAQREYQRALNDFNDSIRLDGREPQIYERRAIALAHLGRQNEANADRATAQRLHAHKQ